MQSPMRRACAGCSHRRWHARNVVRKWRSTTSRSDTSRSSQGPSVLEQFSHWVQHVIDVLGYPGLFLFIMLESTLVPIPSEIIMPFAGWLAAQGKFSLPVVLGINTTAALVGSGVCYWIGAAGGKPLLV